MHRPGVNKQPAVIINGNFDGPNNACFVQKTARFGLFLIPHFRINHADIKHAASVGGVSRNFTYGNIRKSFARPWRVNLALEVGSGR